ncbi:phosphatase PAP2 family protein [Gryllotalpicola ginsengisoli]|uniref:phosphatase PAP2 family protein n=1 Tax=Gryllotalpicola ginsengisoli TaxID=444608 RepID=UPI0009D78CD5|nr:phosphatase PAP2 family protein [Gryllotalpicola ginsengisoli]
MDRRAGRKVYRMRAPRGIDRAMFRLSQAADHASFWVSVIAATALTGSSGRRAAVRGSLTLGAGAVLANLVAKKAVRARRPTGRATGHRPAGSRTPQSPAFPSGHSATAAALATGAAASSPRHGGALAILAGVVAYSRLHVGAHYLSDVLAGSVVGTVLGLTGALLVPPQRLSSPARTSAATPPRRRAGEVPPAARRAPSHR